MKKFYTLLAGAALALSASAAEPAAQLYVIGPAAVTGCEADWNPAMGKECTKTDQAGVFTLDLSLETQQYFGFVQTLNEDWAVVNAVRYVPAAGQLLQEGLNPMKFNSGDSSFCLPEGDFTLTINTVDLTIKVDGAVVVEMGDLYLRGAMNEWSCSDEYKFAKNGEVYTLNVALLEAGQEFKIGNESWLYSFVAAERVTPIGGDEEEIEPNNHLVLDVPYYYTTEAGDGYNNAMEETAENVLITLDLENETIVFTKDAGVGSVAVAEEGAAVYYNLQGVRVANPEKGLFIQVKGGKAAKVVL
ncbi:MAG: hypothetical protein K2M06_00185 [Muribaculaceae bacterium]|nr:hypothetical protein [Muribaculaceae bacterium]